MVAKMTIKNQITIPKKILEDMGIFELASQERYFDVKSEGNRIILKPVKIILEEAISSKQMSKFEKWATKRRRGDKEFNTAEEATDFLKK